MVERLPESEFSESERELIAKLREKGLDDSETRGLLLAWCEVEEKKAETITEAAEAPRPGDSPPHKTATEVRQKRVICLLAPTAGLGTVPVRNCNASVTKVSRAAWAG